MSKRFWIENNEIIDSGFFLSDKEQYVDTMNNLEDIAVKWQRKCADLEAKLAELDSELAENVRENECLKEQLAEKDKEIEKEYNDGFIWEGKARDAWDEIEKLKQRLAEWERDSNATLNEYRAIKYENKQLNKALELAVEQLDDAKDMLRECGKRDWANTLDTSADYFKARAKGMKDE